MAGAVTGLHVFGPDVGPESLTLLDGNYSLLSAPLNDLKTFANSYLDSGAVNALVITVAAPQTVAAYTEGLLVQVRVNLTNTVNNPTLNVNGLGAKTILSPDGSPLAPGQLVAGQYVQFQYSATANAFIICGGSSQTNIPVSDGGALQILNTANPVNLGAGIQVKHPFITGTPIFQLGTGTAFANGSAAGNLDCTFTMRTGNLFIVVGSGTSIEVTSSGIFGFGPVAGALVTMTPDASSFVATVTGFTVAPTPTIQWRRNGNTITVSIPLFSGTSNATTMTITNVPAAIQPAQGQNTPLFSAQANTVAILAYMGLAAGGATWTFNTVTVGAAGFGTNAAGWTAAGTKGVNAFTFSYELS